jgi:hypothetical protein
MCGSALTGDPCQSPSKPSKAPRESLSARGPDRRRKGSRERLENTAPSNACGHVPWGASSEPIHNIDPAARATETVGPPSLRSGASWRWCDVPSRDDGRDQLGFAHGCLEAEVKFRSILTSAVRILWRRADPGQKYGPARWTVIAIDQTRPITERM